jgi:uncharacterized protein YjbI with pentapeptide repeats
MYPTKEQIQEWRNRWTEENVARVKQAFKEGFGLPVGKIPHAQKSLLVLPDTHGERSPQLTYDLRGIPLQNFYLKGIDLSYAHLEGAVLTRANLNEVKLQGAHLEGADLVDAHLEKANLRGVNLRGADLRGARLSNSILREGHLIEANLANANLKGADLRETHLDGVVLAGANLERAILVRSQLRKAYLENARFNRTYIRDTRLEESEDYQKIRWGSDHIIGEEKKDDLYIALDLYRYLKEIYKGTRDYTAFHFRENVVKTKIIPWHHPFSFFRKFFFQWTYGYGSKLLRLFRAAIIVIVLFAILTFLLTSLYPQNFPIIMGIPNEEGDPGLMSSFLPKVQHVIHSSLFSFQSFIKIGTDFVKEENTFLKIIHWKGIKYGPYGLAEILSNIVSLIGIYLAFLFVYGILRRFILLLVIRR